MSKEIERKFLVVNNSYQKLSVNVRHILQGYLSRRPEGTVRVRIIDAQAAFLTIKGKNRGAVRDEWEYRIPVDDAREMLQRCAEGTVVEKDRYTVHHGGYAWDVDIYVSPAGSPAVAEIELPSPEATFALPPFVGREVTGDPRYYNSNL